MLDLDQLGLTPLQMREVEQADPTLVAAWLLAASQPGIKSPTGLFLAGIRTGTPPSVVGDATRARAVKTAMAWIRNVGALVTEEELLAEMYDERGQLRRYRDDKELRAQIFALWQRQAQ